MTMEEQTALEILCELLEKIKKGRNAYTLDSSRLEPRLGKVLGSVSGMMEIHLVIKRYLKYL